MSLYYCKLLLKKITKFSFILPKLRIKYKEKLVVKPEKISPNKL